MEIDPSLPAHYSGVARLFPLPGLVMYPGVIQALQAFEPRYRQLVAHAMDGDRLIAMATQAPPSGGKRGEQMYRSVCLTKIIHCQAVPDGRFFVHLLGLHRGWIRREVPTENLFRMADLRILDRTIDAEESPLVLSHRDDLLPAAKKPRISKALQFQFWKQELIRTLWRVMPPLLSDRRSLERLCHSDLPLYAMTDIVSYLLNLPVPIKLRQLETVDPLIRAQRLVQLLRPNRLRIVTDAFTVKSKRPQQGPSSMTESQDEDLPAESAEDFASDPDDLEAAIAGAARDDDSADGLQGPSEVVMQEFVWLLGMPPIKSLEVGGAASPSQAAKPKSGEPSSVPPVTLSDSASDDPADNKATDPKKSDAANAGTLHSGLELQYAPHSIETPPDSGSDDDLKPTVLDGKFMDSPKSKANLAEPNP